MIVFEKKAAIEVFYYLMSVDGEVTGDELECFDAIGSELDPEKFPEYREEVIARCRTQIRNVIDEEDHYDVISEGVDKALSHRVSDPEKGIAGRLLLWDLLVIAFANDSYSAQERRLIKHLVRTMEMDRTVFLEMEQIIKTSEAVEREIRWIQDTTRPYGQVRPVVEELERRRQVILTCARQLVDDERYIPVEKTPLPGNGLFAGAMEKMSKLGTWGKKTAPSGKKTPVPEEKPKKSLFGGKKTRNQPDAPETEPARSGEIQE